MTAAAATIARAQTITPAPGCQAGVACQANTMAIGGATIGPDALAVTGTASVSGMIVSSAGSIRVTSNTGAFSLGASNDVLMNRDAANALALRNGVNAQAFNLYNTYTDTSNYERGSLLFQSNVLELRSEATGTGTGRNLRLSATGGGTSLFFRSAGSDRWQIDSSGNLLASTDNSWDIGGLGGTNRPRNVNLGGSINAASGSQILFGSRSIISVPVDGDILVQNNAATSFGKMLFGGTTSSFPALKRSAASLQVRLADDSGFAGFQPSFVQLNSNGVLNATADGVLQWSNNAQTNSFTVTVGASNLATFNGSLSVAAAANHGWTGRTQLFSPSDGAFQISNNAGTNVATITASGSGAATFGGGVVATNSITTTGQGIRLTTDAGQFSIGTNTDVILGRLAAASLVLGGADAAAPVAQTLGAQRVATGTPNTAGVNLTLAAGPGTGTGTGGSLVFQVAPAGSTGSTQNALATALTIDNAKLATFAGTVQSSANVFASGLIGTNSNGGKLVLGAATDVLLSRPAAATLQHGDADGASPIAQTLTAQSVVAGTSNTAGPNFTFDMPKGTGTGAGGSFIVRVAPAGSTGSTQNALATALTIDSTKTATFASGGQLVANGQATVNGGLVLNSNQTFGTDNTYNIGMPGANRPANIYASATISADGVITAPHTVSGLPSCALGTDGKRAFVTDATTTTFAAAVIGGGANHVPVYCDGSGTPTWKIG